jgi:secreted protein with Ig-like and vWFA domain
VTEGAENKFGNSGTTVFFNGTGTAPANGQQYTITASPQVVTTKTITFNGLGQLLGTWRNCATMTADIFVGTSVACINGDVHP